MNHIEASAVVAGTEDIFPAGLFNEALGHARWKESFSDFKRQCSSFSPIGVINCPGGRIQRPSGKHGKKQ